MSDSAGFGGFAGERQLDALGRVASVIAHELTNLLQILSSSLDRLAHGHDPDDPTVKTVRASLDRGTRLSRQLQTFAQTTPPRLQARELHELVAAWLPAFEEAVGPDRRLELRLRHSGAAWVDEDQMQTALINLLTNARDASLPDSTIIIELAKSEQPAGGPGCRIAVIDNGEGMTDDVVRQAAAPFFTTRAPGKGMGLGLTIARMVAEAHGGALEIETSFGRGTTVSLFLPAMTGDSRGAPPVFAPPLGARPTPALASSGTTVPLPLPSPSVSPVFAVPIAPSPAHGTQAPPPSRDPVMPRVSAWTEVDASPAAPAPIAPVAPVVPAPGPAPLRSPGRPASVTPVTPHPGGSSAGCVLVVDDEEAIADYFRIILTAERYDVHVVTSAHQALDRFAQDPQRYDTVLLDMMLRDGSGIDLYRKFRLLRPDLPVVVCTGFSDNDSLAPIRADGHDVLFKPCPRGDVIKAVARAVARRRAAGA